MSCRCVELPKKSRTFTTSHYLFNFLLKYSKHNVYAIPRNNVWNTLNCYLCLDLSNVYCRTELNIDQTVNNCIQAPLLIPVISLCSPFNADYISSKDTFMFSSGLFLILISLTAMFFRFSIIGTRRSRIKP